MKLRVKEVIKIKGLTMQQVADNIGVTRDTLTRNINGNPTVETLEKIASALDVPLWQLFSSPDEVKDEPGVITCPNCKKKFRMED